LLDRWRTRPREIAKHAAIFELIRGPEAETPTSEDRARFAHARAALERLRPRRTRRR
jgi:hypothetical protein